jgi:tyrosine-protein phosphatase SIW14
VLPDGGRLRGSQRHSSCKGTLVPAINMPRRAKKLTFVAAFSALCLVADTKPLLFHLLGIPNFHQVNDGLYRGGQPSLAGFESLAKLGVKTVVDLRMPEGQSNWEEKIVMSLGMHYIHIPLHGGETPTRQDVDKAFTILADNEQWPVFVHCREGKDRTGMIIACYRISHDGWTNMRALAEAKSYAFREIRPAMESYIKQYHPSTTQQHPPGH